MLAYQAIQIEDIYVYIYIYIYSNDFCLSRKSASEFEGKWWQNIANTGSSY